MNSFAWRQQFIQLPVRIKELKDMGYLIVSKRNRDASVNYVFLGEVNTSAPVVTTKPKQQWEIEQEAMDKQIRVVKNGQVFYEDVKEPEQMSL